MLFPASSQPECAVTTDADKTSKADACEQDVLDMRMILKHAFLLFLASSQPETDADKTGKADACEQDVLDMRMTNNYR